MRFINRNKLIVLGKMFYNNKDIIVINIVDKVFRFG